MSGVEWLMVQHDQTKEKYNDIFSQASYYLPQSCDGLNEVKNLDHEDWKTDADLSDVADSPTWEEVPNTRIREDQKMNLCAPKAG